MSPDQALLFWIAGFAAVSFVVSAAVIVLYRRRFAHLREQSRCSDSRYRTVVEQAGDGIFLVDAATGRLTESNPALRRRLGYSAAEIVGLKLEDILVESPGSVDTRASARSANTRSSPRTLKQHCKNGQLLDVEVTVSRLQIDGRPTLCYIAHDITDRKNIELELLRNQRRLDHLAHHDSLTGLPNRLFLRNHLQQALRTCGVAGGFAVMLLDLDNFKILNDSRGHDIGDELLIEVARQLKNFVGSRGIVSRLGGDEFVIVLNGVNEQSAAASEANAVLGMLTTPMRISGRVITTSVSIGIALCPQHASDLDTVLRNVDLAMYKAKESGRNNVQFFKAEMNMQVRRRVTMEHALRRALSGKQFVVHYHPLTEIATRRIVGLEALVRWEHPQLGMVPPAKFIPVAEESGLIVPIGELILKTVCEQVVQWQRQGVPIVPVAVNWSAIQLQRQSVVDVVHRILGETGMRPDLLSLEITEGALMCNSRQHAASLQQLRDAGVRVQIDDFGTGYSSLSYLRELPIDTLKIDRSFISRVDESPADQAIVSAILAMAKSLGLRVVAEGVETAEQLEVLERHGCDVAQGFFFSRPLPADQCRALLQEVSVRPSFTDTLRLRLRKGSPVTALRSTA
jgi:diguanylate cyclase (GGDEF)-like protein/PAS domain S-box-containing protein